MLGSLALFITLAFAHPGVVGRAQAHSAPEIIGQRLKVTIDAAPGQLRLDYAAEVPERRVMTEVAALEAAAQPGYAARRLVELAGELRARWNDAPLTLTGVEVDHAARRGEPGFLEFHVSLTAPLPTAAGTLTVQNGNYPDESGFFATEAVIPGGLVVTATSLGQVHDGLLTGSTHGAWTREERARELTLTLAPAGYWERRDASAPLPERMRGLRSLSAPRWLYGVGAAAVGAALMVAGLRARGRA